MLDPQDELYDKRLARHLVSLYYSAAEENESEFLVLIQKCFYSGLIMNLIEYYLGTRCVTRLYGIR